MKGHKPGGGIASKQRVEKPVRYGAAGGAREVHVKGVSQIGTSIGNKVTGKGKNLTDTIRPVRGSPFGQMGSVKLGNELATNVGAGSPGAGRRVMRTGSQSTYGKPNPGNPRPVSSDIWSQFAPNKRGY